MGLNLSSGNKILSQLRVFPKFLKEICLLFNLLGLNNDIIRRPLLDKV